MGRNWTQEDDAIIRAHAENGWSYTAAAAQLGVTKGMVAGRAHRLGIRFYGHRPWMDHEEACIRAMAAKGKSAREIAGILKRSVRAIYQHGYLNAIRFYGKPGRPPQNRKAA